MVVREILVLKHEVTTTAEELWRTAKCTMAHLSRKPYIYGL
jgi:hypothetical protein